MNEFSRNKKYSVTCINKEVEDTSMYESVDGHTRKHQEQQVTTHKD
jgi:hypothetical protein